MSEAHITASTGVSAGGSSSQDRANSIAAISRLQWLMRLRWLALAGVSASTGFAVVGLVAGLNLVIVSLAVVIGIASNGYIHWRLSQRDQIDIESLHVGQALFDTLVLTLVLWAAGGADCPFTSFYVFPVLLAVLLSARRTFWPTAAASFAGLMWQEASCIIPELRVGIWNPAPPWGELFNFLSLVITIGVVAYFAAQFTDAIREQVQAKRAADELLRLSFEKIEAGVELIEDEVTVWQNPFAFQSFGERRFQRWSCPGMDGNRGCHHQAQGCSLNGGEGSARCRFSLVAHEGDKLRGMRMGGQLTANASPIYDVVLLSPPDQSQRVAIYIDQTAEVSYQQKLMQTERLASLGRTAQGMAHELNTPLATIQTLGRDVLDVLENPEQIDSSGIREDLHESTQIILEEVQRCSRITHALLGRADPDKSLIGLGDLDVLERAIRRAVALVFPHDSDRVILSLGSCHALLFPFDPLVQIFVNLIQNARDASADQDSEADVHSAPAIFVTGEVIDEQQVKISVKDQGGGLPAESAILFEPFYTTKSLGQGTGLGLYTSYALAQKLGGELSLQNNVDVGATASLLLPLPKQDRI